MRSLRLLAISTFVIIGTGCAAMVPTPIVWEKPGATQEQFMRDQMTCRQYGMQSATTNGLAGNLFVESWIQRETGNCLRGLGYYERHQ